MQVIVPFDGETPKTRLENVLTLAERREFARAMLRDVLDAIRDAGGSPLVVSRSRLDLPRTPVSVDARPLSTAVNEQLRASASGTAVVMADLPLVTATTLADLFDHDGDVVLAYGKGGGTNALVSRHDDFAVDYHDGSYRTHLQTTAAIGASLAEVDSYRLALDIDEPNDLAELLLYGSGEAVEWLRDNGFSVDDTGGRRAIQRHTKPIPGGIHPG
ncbi:MAG: 2-phospho-L-lactate guanylyltransferase [Haloarcula sp.]